MHVPMCTISRDYFSQHAFFIRCFYGDDAAVPLSTVFLRLSVIHWSVGIVVLVSFVDKTDLWRQT